MQKQIMPDPLQQTYDRENDQHVFAIDRLVQELGVPAEEVNRVYREILAELKKEASLKSLLPPFVSRGVKKRLTGSC